MHDVYITYSVIPDPKAFGDYYNSTHVPICHKLPELVDFAWGFVQDPAPGDPLFVARLGYPSREAADRSFASPEGIAAVKDVANFASEGMAVLHVTREQA